MRIVVLTALLLSGCVAGAYATGLTAQASALSIESDIGKAKYDELEALRLNAGLTRAAYLDELRIYDPEAFRSIRSGEILREAEGRSPSFDRATGVPRHDATADAQLRALPKDRSVWTVDHLLYRARRLIGRASEATIRAELKARDPRWYARLERSGWTTLHPAQ